jgi:hypothetical protein
VAARYAVPGPYQLAFRKPRPLAMPGQARFAELPRTRRGWWWKSQDHAVTEPVLIAPTSLDGS